ncbi:ISL3 family transposase (plasmid) [Cupriavidus sp. P-10]|uniref:ISL3 family transposase n=1 Tax=unclassified Cupriavidus TaxID=2640874 RepID=UPI000E2EB74E|nr:MULTISPECIES: ISL3 family transposase [unclassified Cupriavidus]BDB29760.1 ISL3 family transposase [Cupriavidus sp. P-10]
MRQVLGGIDRILARVGKRFVSSDACGETITVEACSMVRAARCPGCHRWSHRLHGRYVRRLEERPMLEQRVILAIEVRRFKCTNANCPRRTFSENIHALAGRYQRRTRSQARALRALGHALGGEAAARLADALGLRTSADTVLRELRRASGRKRKPRPRVVGIDDWAIARGHQYGTIIVDLERREPIEVFAGRDAIAVAAWMRAHPSIEIVARDRAGAYSEAVDLALPAAKQVSDRWHLLSNLRDNVERLLYRLGPQLRQAAQQVNVSRATLGRQGGGLSRFNSLRSWERLSDQRRATRLALYKQVMALRAQGGTLKGIARELSISDVTVQKFVHAGAFPERAPKARGPTPLDPYRDYIEERILQGCRFPELIWQELKQRGYKGSPATVQSCVARLLFPLGKTPHVQKPVQTMPIPSARRVFGWLVGWRKLAVEEPQSADHERFVQALCKIEPVVGEVRSLAREFLGLMHRRSLRHLDRWLKRLSCCDAVEMRRFAQSLRADLPAVRAAFRLPWSNGQTEGHVNRLKLLKRQMYGRANIDLLRLRVLKPN